MIRCDLVVWNLIPTRANEISRDKFYEKTSVAFDISVIISIPQQEFVVYWCNVKTAKLTIKFCIARSRDSSQITCWRPSPFIFLIWLCRPQIALSAQTERLVQIKFHQHRNSLRSINLKPRPCSIWSRGAVFTHSAAADKIFFSHSNASFTPR